ncbi:MAG: hypothetical protein KJ847_05115, partial [Firmicutes bacterium]|nr:hypothetical protein [Bacillota bacterium]
MLKEKGNKIRLLICSDSVCVQTGFGRVTSELVKRWLSLGTYQIVILGTNDRGEPHPLRSVDDLEVIPLVDVMSDPYGIRVLPEILQKYQPDVVFSLNDIWVWTGDERHPEMSNWFIKNLKTYKPYIPWVGYFPIDGRPLDQLWVNLMNEMSYAVTFCDYGEKVLNETPNVDLSKVVKIYHGSACDKFYPLSIEEKNNVKKNMGVLPDDFLIGIVNRNQPRKQIPRAIQAFKMFRDGYIKCKDCGEPRNLQVNADCDLCGSYEYVEGKDGVKKSYLYLHMNVLDMRGFRLPKVIRDNSAMGLITRPAHDVARGVPVEELNEIYNGMDVFMQ